jgi:Ser/Thr protein kinase RdoA (MazF antagonist)
MKTLVQTRSAGPVKAILKEGDTENLSRERDNITRWHALMPGLSPRIYSFQNSGEESALLLEHLPGDTFESILLERPWDNVVRALGAIQQKLVEVWSKSHSSARVAPRFLQQLSSRLKDVTEAYPELCVDGASSGQRELASFPRLIERLLPYDDEVEAPFSVFIHGDFNIDNVMYDTASGQVRFIDLHRSAMMDYVQDISVFLVSQFRLQFLTAPARRRVHATMWRFFAFADAHAERLRDTSFHQRLALGLARSFATSTRFVLDRELARSMFTRSRHLLERLAELQPRRRGGHVELTREVLLD